MNTNPQHTYRIQEESWHDQKQVLASGVIPSMVETMMRSFRPYYAESCDYSLVIYDEITDLPVYAE